MVRTRSLWAGLAVLGLLVAGCTAQGGPGGSQSGESTLDAVKARGRLICGSNEQVPGFGFRQPDGTFAGFDIDYCKVIAAAVLGDASKVEYRPLVADQRFPVLQSGEVDLLSRNTTWIASRDGGQGAAFATTTFYDGQAMMVRADSPYQRIEDMQDTSICVATGTTTELNLETRFAAAGIRYQPVPFQDVPTLQQAFQAQRCQGWTADRSQLAGIRSGWPQSQGGPPALRILDETFSKEPLGPVVRDGDKAWFDAVNWAVIATIQAEEFGITSQNVDQMKTSKDPDVLRFLGQPVSREQGEAPAIFDPKLGLPPDFAVKVIAQVGNYKEIYDRNVGEGTPLELPRGLNALWTDGGLHYAPPYR
ncbi:MAG: amino acid ABC transporter substrate-binding protein [Egibacteraceae bacterium]